MDLSPGARLGSYEIIEMLGAGGMGQVYGALDLRLKRKVALKILPKDVAGDPARIRRFTREAESVAALSHPNIVTLYSIEEADGVPFLTMELVEGEPLSTRIGPEGLPVEHAIALAVEICDAVAAAHNKGIIHRDLKPANVMVTPSAHVKILDFGLSKQARTSSPSATTQAPSQSITRAGAFLGTVAYMSPEQARGEQVDHRSDVFSFGVMFYEMLVGRRPFTGDSEIAVLSAILSQTPAPLRGQRRGITAALDDIVNRCLQKNPSERYQSASDIRADLTSLPRHGRSLPQRFSARARRAVLAASVLVLVGIAVAAAFVLSRGARGTPPALPSPTVSRISLLTRDGNAGLGAVSADGRYVAHVMDASGRPSLWVRQTQTQNAVQIVPPADARYQGVNYSPDGNYVFYSTTERKGEWGSLYRVSALGGDSETVLRDIDSGAALSAAAKRLAFIRFVITKDAPITSQLITATYDGTDQRVVATLKDPQSFSAVTPAWSADGQRLLVSASNGPVPVQLAIVTASTGKVEFIAGEWGGVTGLAWTSNGDHALVSGRSISREVERGLTTLVSSGPVRLWRVSIPTGDRQELTRDFTFYEGVSLAADDRTVITTRREISSRISVLQNEQLKDVTSGDFDDGRIGLDWIDERDIVFASNRSGTNAMWKVAMDGSSLEKHPFGVDIWWPVGSHDRRYWFFYKKGGLWRASSNGGDATEVAPRINQWNPPVVSIDDRWVYFRSTGGILKVPVLGGAPQVVSSTAFSYGDVLPDGRLVGVTSTPVVEGPGEVEQSVALLTPATGLVTKLDGIPVLAGYNPRARSPLRMTPNHLAITYVDLAGGRAEVWSLNLADGVKRRLTRLNTSTVFWFAWSPKGKLAIAHGGPKLDVVRVILDTQ